MGPIDDGRELVTRFNTNILNNKLSYADANGLETMTRLGNDKQQPISGNYYPQTTRIFIENSDSSNRLTLITDRAHGISV